MRSGRKPARRAKTVPHSAKTKRVVMTLISDLTPRGSLRMGFLLSFENL